MKKEKTIATVLGVCILIAGLIFAVYFVFKGFQAYADDISNYENSVLDSNETSNSESSGICTTCN